MAKKIGALPTLNSSGINIAGVSVAKKIRMGEKVSRYTILKHIHTGQKALSYEAMAEDGSHVFLKQYKSPTPRVPWYDGYVKYEHEKRRRIEENTAKQFCVRILDIFEADYGHHCFFQAFEFVKEGANLSVILSRLSKKAPPLTWDPRLTIAKVLTSAIGAIHKIGLVHGDLKPENVQLIDDCSIRAGYRTKLIDMDASVLTDLRPPWHKHEGYVGTINYHSPEHLRGEVPTPASDIFTCSLILYELLTNNHPFLCNDEEKYFSSISRGKPPAPALLGKLSTPEATDVLRATMVRALSPNASERPTAVELNEALNARLGVTKSPDPPRPPPESRPIVVADIPVHQSNLIISGPNGAQLHCNLTTEITGATGRRFGPDAVYLSDPQFTLRKDAAAIWTLVPNPKAHNETLHNGIPVNEPTKLASGDTIAVGRAASKISKLPLRVNIERG